MKPYACRTTVYGAKCIYDCDTETELHEHLQGGHHFTETLPPTPEPARPEPRQDDGTTEAPAFAPIRIRGNVTLRFGTTARLHHDGDREDDLTLQIPHGEGLVPYLRKGATLTIEIQAERP